MLIESVDEAVQWLRSQGIDAAHFYEDSILARAGESDVRTAHDIKVWSYALRLCPRDGAWAVEDQEWQVMQVTVCETLGDAVQAVVRIFSEKARRDEA
jgi:hypothetical protein